MDNIRPCAREDLPLVADLFQVVFRHTHKPAPQSLCHYLEELYFTHPHADQRVRSLVYEDAKGAVRGFVGALPLRLRWHNQSLTAAVAGSFMIDPALRNPFAGARLFRHLSTGGQDLTLSDTANQSSCRLWKAAGGTTCPRQNLRWIRPLRPSQFLLALAARQRGGKTLQSLLRLPFSAIDRLAAPHFRPDKPDDALQSPHTQASVDELLEAATELGPCYSLGPDYDQLSLAWRLTHARQRSQDGALHTHVVRDRTGHPIGWYLYFAQRGAIARVLQVGARPETMTKVYSSLLQSVWNLGAVGLEARVSAGSLVALAEFGGVLQRGRLNVLAHAPHRELAQAVNANNALFSRLEGEWWTRLNGGTFA